MVKNRSGEWRILPAVAPMTPIPEYQTHVCSFPAGHVNKQEAKRYSSSSTKS
jgi:hypothetical protein